jgi:hypothetical protein
LLDSAHPSSRLASEVLRKKKLPGESKIFCGKYGKSFFGFPVAAGCVGQRRNYFSWPAGSSGRALKEGQNVSDLLWRLCQGRLRPVFAGLGPVFAVEVAFVSTLITRDIETKMGSAIFPVKTGLLSV